MIIVDDFIKDEGLLAEIAADESFFANNGKYYWWNGFWNSPANTLKKRLIEYIWGERSPHSPLSTSGFEYWTGQHGEGHQPGLKMHTDKDEPLWEKTGEVVGPKVGSVFYPVPLDIDGGRLEIFSNTVNKEPEVIQPKFNRLIIFDAGGHFHRVTPVTRGVRSAIAINVWSAPPSGVSTLHLKRE